MTCWQTVRIIPALPCLMFSLALGSVAVAAQTLKLEGFIKARDGDTMILQTSASPKLVVLLTDTTKVAQVQGLLTARRKEMSMAALITGLAVKAEGNYNGQEQLVATSVSLKGNDLDVLHRSRLKARE